ncbi:hypothetical protein PJ15_1995 [Acinetobacter sp. neg1]|nr:hypothetical protein PJ15_1995 [Acinetobacter sp. neg1]
MYLAFRSSHNFRYSHKKDETLSSQNENNDSFYLFSSSK